MRRHQMRKAFTKGKLNLRLESKATLKSQIPFVSHVKYKFIGLPNGIDKNPKCMD